MEQVALTERFSDRRRNAHAHGTTDPSAAIDRRATGDAGALDAPTHDGAGPRGARPRGARMRGRQDEHCGGAGAAADQADDWQMAHSVSPAAPRWVAR